MSDFDVTAAERTLALIREQQQQTLTFPDTARGYEQLRQLFQRTAEAISRTTVALRTAQVPGYVLERLPGLREQVAEARALARSLAAQWADLGRTGEAMAERRDVTRQMLNLRAQLLQVAILLAEMPTQGAYNADRRRRMLGDWAPLVEGATSGLVAFGGGAAAALALVLLVMLGGRR